MADPGAAEAKLIQYLNEAYGKEKQLETALQAHISMTTRDAYKKKLQEHLKETKSHAREVERRIKALGGSAGGLADIPQEAANRAAALAQGPLHMVRGTGEQEKLLRNARTEYQDEAEEIASYTAIETLAQIVGDDETAKLARSIRRDEEKMARYLERLIPTLTKAVARDEVPASERRTRRGSRRRRSRSKRSSSGRGRSSSSSGRSRSSGGRSSSSGRSRSSSGRSGGSSGRSRSSGGRSSSGRSSGGTRSSGSSRSGSRSSSSSRSGGGSRSGGSGSRSGGSSSQSSRGGGSGSRSGGSRSGSSSSSRSGGSGSRGGSSGSRSGSSRGGRSGSSS